MAVSGEWYGVDYSNGRWVAESYGGYIATSTGSINWSTQTVSGNWYGVAIKE
jgi:hypothetical protein